MKAFWNPVRACLIVALLLSRGAGVQAAPPAVHFAVPSPVGAQTLPQNPSVAFGAASFNTQGSQLTINTSDRAFINWGSFNIGADASTTFVQPSTTSVVWNHISDPNASQILGHLDANGLVILQNSSGFYVGGQAAINTGGLVMTTSPTVPLDISSGGAWQFNAPPPTASIINYGQINSIGGGPVFLIAHDIENQGGITAPGGSIGLYAGKEVLVSERPDGRSLTAAVTLPQGSVDNSGRLIADGGNIALHAQVVNQGGLIQANSVRTVNGVIELVASDEANLDASSVIEAKGDARGRSSGGSVTIKSDASYSDATGSTIDVSGGAQGGNGGQVEISAPQMSAINSKIDGHATAGSKGGKLLIDPDNILLSDGSTVAPPDTMLYNVNSDFSGLSDISLQANFNIELNTLWSLSDPGAPTSLTLQAGRNITLDDGSGIDAGKNWTINMTAGKELTSAANIVPGQDGIYVHGHAFIQAQNGNVAGQPTINLSAANEVVVDSGDIENVSDNGIRTLGGGSVNVTTEFGDINSGGNSSAYRFLTGANFYTVDTRPGSHLGGISTAAGGDVTLAAGGDVISYLPLPLGSQQLLSGGTIGDAGSGAFGPQPGNVTITAGGSIFGHYVVANGTGNLTAGVNVGDPSQGLALSLISGAWNVNAPNGSIYMQEVRNPNGIFNNTKATAPGYYNYNYDPHDSVSLDAGNLVDFLGGNLPRTAPEASILVGIPLILYPPTLNITAGEGGVILNSDLTLFPSSFGELTINTPGGFIGNPSPNDPRPTLRMSDSNGHQWVDQNSFNADPGTVALELSNPDQTPQVFNIGGDVKTVNFVTTRPTTVNVGGEMDNASFNGENLRPGDVTAINVAGRIFDRNVFTFEILTQGIQPIDPAIVANWNLFLNSAIPKDWTAIFALAVDPNKIASFVVKADDNTPQKLIQDLLPLFLFQQGNPGFVYNTSTKRLGFQGVMPSSVRSEMEGTLEIVRLDVNGLPVVDANGHFVTQKISFVDTPEIETLYNASQDAPPRSPSPPGFQIGGPGFFKITAASLDLGNSEGIESWGVGDRYASLVGIQSGAEIDVKLTGNASLGLTGDLSMISSRIASFDGGDVNVSSASGTLDLGSQEVLGSTSGLALGVYTTGHSDVNVNAFGDINIDGSRIAAYNGGSINVESTHGNVNIGTGGTGLVEVEVVLIDPMTGQVVTPPHRQPIFGSGLVTTTLPVDFQSPGGSPVPGNITVNAPLGNISSSAAGVLQLALDGNVSSISTVRLTAGTDPDPNVPGSGFLGNIDLGDGSGVIGGTVILKATGDIKGLVISSGNSTITAGQTFSGVNLSAGTSTVSATDISGTVIAVGGITASGVTVGATLLSQNVSVGGATSQSTLGTTATATSTATAAAASEDNQGSDKNKLDVPQDEDDLKKKAGRPLLAKTTGRVTVILPPTR